MSEIISPAKLSEEGKSAYQRGDYLTAAETFQKAVQAYQAAHDELNTAEAANNCSVAYLQAGEAEASLNVVEGTPAIFAAAGDLRRQGMALGNYAAALEALERLEEAAEAYLQSADALEQAGEDQLRTHAMQSLSALQFRMGRQLQALASMKSGLDSVKRPTPKQRLLKQLLAIPFQMINKQTGKAPPSSRKD
jgi:tetratricopeptide (TPR) repeat protein